MKELNQLKSYANEFLEKNYGIKLEVPLILNPRMRTTYGWFKYRKNKVGSNKSAISVELSKFFVENNNTEVVLDVLRHELIHYALFMMDKPFKDGNPTFENELKKLSIVSQSNVGLKHKIKNKPKNMNLYICSKCNHKYHTARKLIHDGKYHSCNCGGKLLSSGKVLV